jgi:hypothetical protein
LQTGGLVEIELDGLATSMKLVYSKVDVAFGDFEMVSFVIIVQGFELSRLRSSEAS